MNRFRRGIFFVFVFSFCSFFVTPNVAMAQQTAFEKAFNNYKLSLEEYNSKHDEYVLARSQYLKFKTLTSQNKAKDATRDMLTARDNVVIAYFNSLAEKIKESESIDPADTDRMLTKISEEIGWLEDHKLQMIGATTLDDLVKDSNEAKKRYDTLGPIIYETLSQVPLGRVVRFHERFNENFLAIREKIELIQADQREEYRLSPEKLKTIDRWVTETISTVDRSDQKLNDTVVIVDKFETSKTNFGNSLKTNTTVINQLLNSVEDLKDASINLTEIINEIKTK